MNVFYINRPGVHAIVVASNPLDALFELNKVLPSERRIAFPDINPTEFIKLDPFHKGARLLEK